MTYVGQFGITTPMYRIYAIFLALFSIISLAVMLSPAPVGWKFAILVVLFHLGAASMAFVYKKRWPELLNIWVFASLASVFQVFPDWFLSTVLGVLVFPEDGFFKIGSVSAYMAGLWAIPFSIVLLAAIWAEERSKKRWLPGFVAATVAFLLFAGSEATLWALGSWYARDVHMVFHVALYVLLPETILGLHVWLGFQTTKERSLAMRLIVALHICVFYTGALALSYLLMEKLT